MKRTLYSNPERRKERQEEAEARKAERAKRTPEEQMDTLRARGVTSGREWDRLCAQILKAYDARSEAAKKVKK